MTQTENGSHYNEADAEKYQMLRHYDRASAGAKMGGVQLTGLTIRYSTNKAGDYIPGGEVLVVVKAYDAEGTRWVGFHSAMSMIEALAGTMIRIRNGSIKWKVDEFYNKR